MLGFPRLQEPCRNFILLSNSYNKDIEIFRETSDRYSTLFPLTLEGGTKFAFSEFLLRSGSKGSQGLPAVLYFVGIQRLFREVVVW